MTEEVLPLSPELFAQIRAIQIRTQRLVTETWAGNYESAFRGQGIEFADVRAYQPGDEIRSIDWKVTARTGLPFVKEHKEERELTVMLTVDVSSSGNFGSVEKHKREIAAEISAVLAYSAIKSNDKVGLVIFSDHIEHFIPPKKGRAHLWRVIRDILTYQPSHSGTSLKTVIDFLGHVIKRRAVIFLVSDFLDNDFMLPLQLLAQRHDITAINISDPRELSLPKIGLVEFEDLESGQRIIVDTNDQIAMKHLATSQQQRVKNLSESLRAAGVGEIKISTDISYITPIINYFHQREHRYHAKRRS
ncbi:MAG: DUF58 domain-containing protein [Deltaproteobacteria bacterium]|nr:DUF58 domain-containing protein [Deltaproteobacteria bacterium]